MAASSSKVLPHVLTVLSKKMPAAAEPDKRPVMEELIYAICREGVTSAEADAAFASLKSNFFDWNEVRVSTVPEVTQTLGELPDAGTRAKKIIEFLQELFEMTYAFHLDDLEKKGLKQASKQLARYQAVSGNDYLVAWVVQRSLSGHAVPLDGPALRVLRRLGVLSSDEDDLETLRGQVESVIGKSKAFEFTELLSSFAASVCTELKPGCKNCPLLSDCPTGQELTSPGKKATKDVKDAKPKKTKD